MKTPLKTISLLASAAFFTLSNLTAVETDPVGYVSSEIPAHDGGGSTLFLLNLALLPTPDFSGSIASYSGSQINVATGALTGLDFSATDANGMPLYYVEFTSGTDTEGLTVEISSNTDNSLVLEEDISSILANGITFNVREFVTIADIFGSDNSAYQLFSAGNANSSDVLYLEDNAGGLTRYYYQTAPSFAGGNGWRVAGDTSTDKSNVRINWNAILLSRNGTARDSISITNSGAVKMGKAVSTISNGLNLVGYQFPLGTTLGSLGFDTADLQSGANANESDVIYLLEEGQLSRFYYQTAPAFAGGTGWRKAGDTSTDQSSFSIDTSAAVLVLRRGVDPIYMSSAQPF